MEQILKWNMGAQNTEEKVKDGMQKVIREQTPLQRIKFWFIKKGFSLSMGEHWLPEQSLGRQGTPVTEVVKLKT